jgi:hypothetical protein
MSKAKPGVSALPYPRFDGRRCLIRSGSRPMRLTSARGIGPKARVKIGSFTTAGLILDGVFRAQLLWKAPMIQKEQPRCRRMVPH